MTKAKNNIIGLSVFAGLVILVGLVSFATKLHAQPSSFAVQTTAVATTTRLYIGNGTATSTYQIDSGNVFSTSKVTTMMGIDTVYLYTQVEASSTATVFTFTPQYSNNNVDWYNYGTPGTIASNGAQAVSTSTVFTLSPETVATSSMAFKLPDFAELHQRIVVSATGGNGAVYMEIVLKRNPSTP